MDRIAELLIPRPENSLLLVFLPLFLLLTLLRSHPGLVLKPGLLLLLLLLLLPRPWHQLHLDLRFLHLNPRL